MKTFSGSSVSTDAITAVSEATKDVPAGADPDVVLAFCSTKQLAEGVAKALAERFPRSIVTGCTTSGEHVGDQHLRGSLVVAALFTPEIRWALDEVDLATVDEASARATADRLLHGLGKAREDLDPRRQFCLTFMDGLSLKEEGASSLMAEALEGIPLLGGSAGDDLAFRETRVFTGGQAKRGVAAFLLADSKADFTVLKHQHYTTTPKSLVITRADVPNRRVYEMDGFPALEAYASALGLTQAQVTSDVTFLNPVTFVCNDEIYVRSIQKVEPDGALVFYCAIEEGMVLSVGGHEEMARALERDIGSLKKDHDDVELFIACNCILRALEAEQSAQHDVLGKIVKSMSRNVIGFDTYGEQLNGLHINQTLVGIALHGAKGVGP
jgi:hypothetical protein